MTFHTPTQIGGHRAVKCLTQRQVNMWWELEQIVRIAFTNDLQQILVTAEIKIIVACIDHLALL